MEADHLICILLSVQFQCFFKAQTFYVYGLPMIMWNFPMKWVGKLLHIAK